jgi:hypothetical protein
MRKGPVGLESTTLDQSQPPRDDIGDPPADGVPAADPPALARTRDRRIGTRMAVSVPGAMAGAFLITALAFGAATRLTASSTGSGSDGSAAANGRETTPGTSDGADAALGQLGDGAGGAVDGDHVGDVTTEPASEPGTTDADRGDSGDAVDPADEPTTEPTDKPTEQPAAEPPVDPASVAIAIRLGDGRVTISWGSCERDGFVVWKIVRSLDGKPTWPLGTGDRLVAASENEGLRSVQNGDLPAGKTVWYRVYALVERNGERVVGCVSRIADIRIPAADPEPTPTPVEIGSLALTVALGEGKPVVDWSACSGDWDLYKVVRSTDSTARWPLGDGDSLAAVVGKDGATKVRDGDAPAGKTAWYRVFCVRAVDGGYKVVAASSARAIEVPAEEPQPEPDAVSLDFQVEVTDGGAVALHWGACSNDSFVAYKVLRSAGSDPSYLPLTDGTQVRSVIENAAVTSYTDGDVASGQTWTYRVQCIGYVNGHKILLGETAATSVTLP